MTENPKFNRFAEFARAPRSQLHRQHIADALRGKKRPDLSEKQTSIWMTAYPLVIRNAAVFEIVALTDLTWKQARALIDNNNKRGFMAVPEYDLPENVAERSIRTYEQRSETRRRIAVPQERLNAIELDKKLLANGFFPNENTNWNRLRQLYVNKNRNLPAGYFDQLRLEAFMHARMVLDRDADQSLLVKYMEIGAAIDREWFEKSLVLEEDFISKQHTYDGEDEIGFYRIRNGKKWYQPMETGEGGGLLVDSSVLAVKRKAIRNGPAA